MRRLGIVAVGLALVVGIVVGSMVGNLFGASAQHTATAASPVSALSVGAALGAALSTATASAPVAGVTGGAQLTAAVATATATAPSATAMGGASLAASVATATASTLPATFQGATTGTLDLLVDASSDDATELYSGGGPMTLDGTNMGVHYNPGDLTDRWVALRFRSGSFPAKGSTITAAYLTVYSIEAYGDDANLDIYAQDAESPGTFTSTNGDISSRTLTAHSVAWVADNLGNGWVNSPSLVSVIQELVTDYDCTAIALILKGKHDVDKMFYIATWDYTAHLYGAKLHLEWTEAGGGDADGDGCTNARELALGLNPNAWYDFYDVPVPVHSDPTPNGTKNRAVNLLDVLAVLKYVPSPPPGGTLDTPNVNGVAYNSIKGSCDANGDTVPDKEGLCYDRSTSPAPNPPWDAGPPDSAISLQDVIAALKQYGLDCREPP